MTTVETWTRAASLNDIPEGEMLALNLDGTKVALYRLDSGEVYATANVCTHEYALLTDGWLEGCEVECPLHSGRFDVRNGKALCEPLKRDVRTYPVRIDGDDIYLDFSESGQPAP